MMITKNYKSIFSYIAALTIGFFIVSCDQEDVTGLSTLVPASPTLSVSTEVSSASLIEDNSVYTFTATLSTPQLVDVKLFVSQIGGDATAGSDYTVDGSLTISAGATSASGEIKILSDDLIEATETVQIQIGDNATSNAAMTPATMDFTILNYADGDLVVDMGWAMSTTTDDAGNAISATDFADLRLLISTSPNNSDLIGGADGGSFETYVLTADTPDGDYYVVADFYDASRDIIRDLDLNLTFNQAGVINGDNYSYPAAISNLGICDLNFYVMTKITKSGSSYTFEDVSTQSYEFSVYSPWDYGFDSVDAWSPAEGYSSHIETKEICDGFFIQGLNAEWMLNSWGEEIQPGAAEVFASLASDGTFTINSQSVFTTKYDGSLYPYTITGSGTFDSGSGELHVEYYLDQEGFDVSGWMFDNGYMDTDYFEATVTLAP